MSRDTQATADEERVSGHRCPRQKGPTVSQTQTADVHDRRGPRRVTVYPKRLRSWLLLYCRMRQRGVQKPSQQASQSASLSRSSTRSYGQAFMSMLLLVAQVKRVVSEHVFACSQGIVRATRPRVPRA